MENVLQVESTPAFSELVRAIENYGTCKTPSETQEKRILALSRAIDPTQLQEHLAQLTTYAVVVAASYQAKENRFSPSRFDDQVQRYDHLRYLIDTDIEQRECAARQLKQLDSLLAHLNDPNIPSPSISKDTAALCTQTIYGDFTNDNLLDALTVNTTIDSTRSIPLKDVASITCQNEQGQISYLIEPLDGKALELSDIFQDMYLTLSDLLQYQSVFDPSRYIDQVSPTTARTQYSGLDNNATLNRAQESRTESEATSMATNAVIDAPESTSKRSRHNSKNKQEKTAQEVHQPEEHQEMMNIEPEPEQVHTEDIDAEEQRHLAAMEKESGAPAKGSYLREAQGYDALSPEQKTMCDKDFQSYLEKRSRPIEQREGESREDAVLRAKQEYCVSRQEHTARHGKIAQTMLKSKINCLKTDRTSFSLMNPDVAKEFLATAFYHHAVTTKNIENFDRETFAKCKNAAQREFSAFASSVETGKDGMKEFNNTFVLGIQRPPIGSPSNNLRIAVSPLPEKREDLAAIFGKCAYYHSNRSGRTPEEREQRKVARTKQQSDLSR